MTQRYEMCIESIRNTLDNGNVQNNTGIMNPALLPTFRQSAYTWPVFS